MWDETKQQQLNELQKRKDENNLTAEDEKMLESLFSEVEQEEWKVLNPALENLRGEQIELQKNINQTKTQTAILSAFASHQEDLIKSANRTLLQK